MDFSRYRKSKEEVEVNLIPVMNLFVTLIPFLLLAAAFYHVGVIPASLPSQTDEKSDIASDVKSVTVDLLIAEDRIELSVSNAVLDEETLAALAVTIPKKKDGYDLDLLTEALLAIKGQYVESDTVVVLPEDKVRYQDVVRVLDVTREQTINKDQADEKRVPLFPVVVLSRKV